MATAAGGGVPGDAFTLIWEHSTVDDDELSEWDYYRWHDRTLRMPSAYGLCFAGLGNKVWLCDIAQRHGIVQLQFLVLRHLQLERLSVLGQAQDHEPDTVHSCLVFTAIRKIMHSNNSVQKIRFANSGCGSAGTTQIPKDIYLEGMRTNWKLHWNSQNSAQKSMSRFCRCWVCNHSNSSPKMAIFPMERDFSKSESIFLIIVPKNLMFKAKIMYFGLILGAREPRTEMGGQL